MIIKKENTWALCRPRYIQNWMPPTDGKPHLNTLMFIISHFIDMTSWICLQHRHVKYLMSIFSCFIDMTL